MGRHRCVSSLLMLPLHFTFPITCNFSFHLPQILFCFVPEQFPFLIAMCSTELSLPLLLSHLAAFPRSYWPDIFLYFTHEILYLLQAVEVQWRIKPWGHWWGTLSADPGAEHSMGQECFFSQFQGPSMSMHTILCYFFTLMIKEANRKMLTCKGWHSSWLESWFWPLLWLEQQSFKEPFQKFSS